MDVQAIHDVLRHTERRINLLKPIIGSQEREGTQTKQGVEYIRHVSGAITEPSRLRVLERKALLRNLHEM